MHKTEPADIKLDTEEEKAVLKILSVAGFENEPKVVCGKCYEPEPERHSGHPPHEPTIGYPPTPPLRFPINSLLSFKVLNNNGCAHIFATGWLEDVFKHAIRQIEKIIKRR